MKIELNVSDNFFITKKHLKLIVNELIENIVEDETHKNYKNDIFYFPKSKLNIEDTKKINGFECGNRIGKSNIHYSKKTTPSGTIKINVWGN